MPQINGLNTLAARHYRLRNQQHWNYGGESHPLVSQVNLDSPFQRQLDLVRNSRFMISVAYRLAVQITSNYVDIIPLSSLLTSRKCPLEKKTSQDAL
jgi:hypothetical protein